MAAADEQTGWEKIERSDAEWKKLLTREQFRVTRKKGTERAFTGELWNNKRDGVYRCICCDLPLFDSKTKFDSGTGWPSFYEPLRAPNIGTEDDFALFYRRIEVHCNRCGAHLGHVFDDGPAPTGLRYCLNSVALKFEERSNPADADRKVGNDDSKSDPAEPKTTEGDERP